MLIHKVITLHIVSSILISWMKYYFLRQYSYTLKLVIRRIITNTYYWFRIICCITYFIIKLNSFSGTYRRKRLIMYWCTTARLYSKTFSPFSVNSSSIKAIKGHICPITSNCTFCNFVNYIFLIRLSITSISCIHIENSSTCGGIRSTIINNKVLYLFITKRKNRG